MARFFAKRTQTLKMNPNPTRCDAGTSKLALVGASGFDASEGRVLITIDQIANNRPTVNVSGTLAVELWALPQPYAGGDFQGHAVAGTMIGELSGQHYLSNCRYDLLFNEPPVGRWHMTLMLREWTELGFVTRDYVNFTVAYQVDALPRIERSASNNVINLRFVGRDNVARPSEIRKSGEPQEAEVGVEPKSVMPAPADVVTPTPTAQAAQKRGVREVAASPAAISEISAQPTDEDKGIDDRLAAKPSVQTRSLASRVLLQVRTMARRFGKKRSPVKPS
jgi:hypothetical protein